MQGSAGRLLRRANPWLTTALVQARGPRRGRKQSASPIPAPERVGAAERDRGGRHLDADRRTARSATRRTATTFVADTWELRHRPGRAARPSATTTERCRRGPKRNRLSQCAGVGLPQDGASGYEHAPQPIAAAGPGTVACGGLPAQQVRVWEFAISERRIVPMVVNGARFLSEAEVEVLRFPSHNGQGRQGRHHVEGEPMPVPTSSVEALLRPTRAHGSPGGSTSRPRCPVVNETGRTHPIATCRPWNDDPQHWQPRIPSVGRYQR